LFPNAVAALRTTKHRLANRLSSAHHKKRAVAALDACGKQVSLVGMFYGGESPALSCRTFRAL